RQVDVNGRRRLKRRIVVFLMKGDGEHVAIMRAAQPCSLAEHLRPRGGQRIRGNSHAGEDRGCSVTLMDVTIYGHGSCDLIVALHATDRDRYVVDHAEALAVIRKGMMEAASDVERDLIVQRVIGGKNRATGSQPESAYQFRRVGNLHLEFFARRQRSGLQFVYVLRRVHEQDVMVRRGLRGNKILWLGDPAFKQTIMYAAVFFGREHVRPDGEIIVVAVDELERKHSAVSPPGTARNSL